MPGVPAAWAALSTRFGTLPYGDLFTEAIRYAHDGFPVSPVCAHYWNLAETRYRSTLTDTVFKEWFKVFAPDGAAPRAGQIWGSKDHARTLAELAKTGSGSFYRGRLADTIDSFSRTTGGFLRRSDLEGFVPGMGGANFSRLQGMRCVGAASQWPRDGSPGGPWRSFWRYTLGYAG
ncbi:hypothetical protein MASR2M48_34630 [Spirochaetota bacterium]